MSRLSLAQSQLNDALEALESALESARVNPCGRKDGESLIDNARMLADLQGVDAKVAKAVEIINASLTTGSVGEEKP